MNHVLREVGLRVPDLDASVAYAVGLLGLEELDRAEGRCALGFANQPPCLILSAGASAGLGHIGFVTSAENLEEIARRAQVHGIAATDRADGLRLAAPNGMVVQFAVGTAPAPNTVERPTGPTVAALDHLSLKASDIDAVCSFFTDVLGFRLSDSVEDKRHWLRCGPNHHTIAVFQGEDGLHHYAFAVAEFAELRKLGDLLASRGENFLWGPGRHSLGANVFSYLLDPAGSILEVCSDMFQIPDETAYQAQVWMDGLPSAVMWGPPPTADFRTRVTPLHVGTVAA